MTTLTVGNEVYPDSFPAKDARAAINSQPPGLSALTLPVSTALPPGQAYFPDRFPAKDARAAVTSHIWPDFYALVNLTTLPPGMTYLPASFPRRESRVAVGAQDWVRGSGVIAQGAPNGPPPFPPPPSFPDRIWSLDRQVSVRSQSDQHILVPSTVAGYASAVLAGTGTLKGVSGWTDTDPLNYIPSWSIQILGATIYGAEYDPSTRNLKVWFSAFYDFQFVVLPNMPFNVTVAIQLAPAPEAYVLSLLGVAV